MIEEAVLYDRNSDVLRLNLNSKLLTRRSLVFAFVFCKLELMVSPQGGVRRSTATGKWLPVTMIIRHLHEDPQHYIKRAAWK